MDTPSNSYTPFVVPDTRSARLPRLFRTASFKLAAFYAAVFGASVLVLGAVVYFAATSAYEGQLRARITSESASLQDIYKTDGEIGLRRAIAARSNQRSNRGLEYGVYDPSGKFEVGTLPGTIRSAGWIEIKAPPDGDEEPGENEYLAVLGMRLSDGHWLAVGDDLNRVDELGETIVQAFGWALGVSVTLAILGGALLSNLFLRRIDVMTRAAETIIEGDIHHRIAVRHTNDDLDHLANTLNRMLDRIGSLMETTRQITNDIAHDLRTPIGRLRQSLEEARRTSRSVGELESAIERAIAETDSILETFSALLRIAQIEAGSRKAGFCNTDLSEIIESVVQTFSPSAEDADQTLHALIEPGIRIHGDRELLTQMVVNLVENALMHTTALAHIEVSLKGKEKPILTIADNGTGVPEAERERIFQRFYRLDPSRTGSGNGLGLTLVAAIAGLHAIKIDAEGNNPGLRMVLQFPSILH